MLFQIKILPFERVLWCSDKDKYIQYRYLSSTETHYHILGKNPDPPVKNPRLVDPSSRCRRNPIRDFAL